MRVWVITCLVILLGAAANAAPTAYTLQKDDSTVGFSWFLGKEEIKGRMPVEDAEIAIDFRNVANSRVKVSVDVARARAGFPFASQGMKSRRVLWADKYPLITFESTRVQRQGDGALIEGDLTVRGVTRPVAFDALLFRQQGTDEGDRSRLTFRLTGSLSRAAFGADGWADMAGDEVILSIVARITRSE